MISTGNDIVSLTATNVTRSKSPEFYSKIISPAEKALFESIDQDVLPFDRFVWLLWSVKESAYKYLHRLDPGIVFTPVKFEIQSIAIPTAFSNYSLTEGEITCRGFDDFATFNIVVEYAGKKLFSRVIIQNELVSAVVNHTDDFQGIYWGLKQVEDTSHKHQSAAVREFALTNFSEISGLQHLSIVKNNNDIPVLMNHSEPLPVPISLSHHGQWIAYSFQNPDKGGN